MVATLERPAIGTEVEFDTELEPMAFSDMEPILPKRKVMLAMPTYVTIFCREYTDAATLVNELLKDHDYSLRSAVTTLGAGDWEYEVDEELYLFRWRYPTMTTIRGTKGDYAYVRHDILNSEVIDYIRINHMKGVYFF